MTMGADPARAKDFMALSGGLAAAPGSRQLLILSADFVLMPRDVPPIMAIWSRHPTS